MLEFKLIHVSKRGHWQLSPETESMISGITAKQAFINGVPPEVTIWAAQDVALNSSITSAFKKQGPDSI